MNNLRITAGRYKGRTIPVPKGELAIRPAMEMMRESLFSIISPLEYRSFLDLFSGSGIIGLEAASRGAQPIACVERDKAKFHQLLQNVKLAEQRIECHCLPVERYVQRCKTQWDIIFCDPPFPYQFKLDLLLAISNNQLLKPDGILLIHHPSKEHLPDTVDNLSLFDERKYGNSTVRFYHIGSVSYENSVET